MLCLEGKQVKFQGKRTENGGWGFKKEHDKVKENSRKGAANR